MWFNLAIYGVRAHRDAIEATLAVAKQGAQLIRDSSHLQLVKEPSLSVIVFRRISWTASQYESWSERILAQQTAFVATTTWNGETVLRFCLVNPKTTKAHLKQIFDTLK